MQTHHLQIQARRKQTCLSVWEDELTDQQLRETRFHGVDGVLEDLQALLIRPVMEDGAEVVDVGG